MGHKAEILFNGLSKANNLNIVNWDASNYSSGDYFIHLESDSFYEVQKVTLIK